MLKTRLLTLLCISSLALFACGDDDGGGIDASTIDGASTIDSAPAIDAPGSPDANGIAPVVTSVVWTHAGGCVNGTAGSVTVVITATDADTAPGQLTFSGTTGACGALTGATTTFTCPNANPYGYTATVMDPQGNSDSQVFTISPCTDGSEP